MGACQFFLTCLSFTFFICNKAGCLFRLLKRCEFSTSKEICRLAYQGRVFGILYFVYLLISIRLFFTIDCIYLFDIFALLVSYGSWLYFRFNQWIIIPEREDALLIARSGRTCSRSPASPATSTGPPRTRTSSRVTSRSAPLFGPLTLRRIYHAADHQIQVGLKLLIILIVCFDPALR